jgi:aminomethyltransferase
LEKCFALASNEFAGGRTPLEAGLGWLINWNHDFIGKDALVAQKEKPYDQMTYLRCDTKGVPRQGCSVQYKGSTVGVVSSGTLSPCLNTGIAMTYVNQDFREVGQALDIMGRGKKIEASVVKMPFVKKGEC